VLKAGGGGDRAERAGVHAGLHRLGAGPALDHGAHPLDRRDHRRPAPFAAADRSRFLQALDEAVNRERRKRR
jgi:hypothetical protein